MKESGFNKKTYKFIYRTKEPGLPKKDLPRKMIEIVARNESEAWKRFRRKLFGGKEYCFIALEIKGQQKPPL